MKNALKSAALALTLVASADMASSQAETLAVGSIISTTTLVTGIVIATVVIAVADDGSAITTTTVLP